MSPYTDAKQACLAGTGDAALPHLKIFDRLIEYPVLSAAVDFANQRYVALKHSNQLINQTLLRAEKSVQVVVETTVAPLICQWKQPIKQADTLAVQSLDLVHSKVIDPLEHKAVELKHSTSRFADQTKQRYTQLRSSVVPLLEQVLNVGENVLDYLLPADGGKLDADDKMNSSSTNGHEQGKQNGSPRKSGNGLVIDTTPQEHTAKDLFRVVIVRMRNFSEKVQRRISHYTRHRWLPTLLHSLLLLKTNVVAMANKSMAGSKFFHKVFPSSIVNGPSPVVSAEPEQDKTPAHGANSLTGSVTPTRKSASEANVSSPKTPAAHSSPQSNGESASPPLNKSKNEDEASAATDMSISP